ncbi:MAG TPA: hypothetical protein VIJ14_07050 [Rhabdochlamydiaceae bacterium]
MVDSLSPINESPRTFQTETDVLATQANKVTDAVTGKILYCNGMTTSHELALNQARTVAELTGLEVELHYNNTTSTEQALKITSKLGIGCLAIGFALASRGRWLVKAIGILGLASFVSGVIDLNKIEKQKMASAEKMAEKVSTYLEAHPMHHLTMILHSQGADIGHRALEKLSAYKSRISVVTIGGMIDIPDGLALRVVNFVNENDMISHLSKTLFDPKAGPKTRVQIPDKKTPYLNSHFSLEYLNQPPVKKTIQDIVKSPFAVIRQA